ncbi:hypothetical protein MYX76_10525 [Desulfobacterota bacterium AH_259_B03_O07]|nr:hypothetical protein [Desulfobacterota bacterium AH_259_B03_O07]
MSTINKQEIESLNRIIDKFDSVIEESFDVSKESVERKAENREWLLDKLGKSYEEGKLSILVDPVRDQIGSERIQTLKTLFFGNRRYVSRKGVTFPSVMKGAIFPFMQLQGPSAVVIVSGTESRLPPNADYIFDQEPGNLLVVRTKGAFLGSGNMATIEKAVSAGAEVILGLGHSHSENVNYFCSTVVNSPTLGPKIESGAISFFGAYYRKSGAVDLFDPEEISKIHSADK